MSGTKGTTGSGPAKPLTQMTDAELEAEEGRLRELKAEVRDAQNAAIAERETRVLLRGLSGGSREAVRVRLEGNISSIKGETGASATEGGKA